MHVFNIILKLNYHPWKKVQNFFVEKIDTEISRAAVVEKAPKSLNKIFFEKKPFQLICTDKTYKTKFFQNKWISRYLIFTYHKIINKTWSTENQENSPHRFGDNYLTNHLVKFLQDRIKP